MTKKIHFKKIIIAWFKGIKESTTFELKENEVEFDKNGTFKTTRLDAISFLFTNKLLNGNVNGWEHLNENNELSNQKPFIELHLSLNDVDFVITLNNGVRYINEIKFTKLADFMNEWVNLSNINQQQFHLLVNPYYLLNYVDTKTARSLFLDTYSFDVIQTKINEVESFDKIFWNKLKITKDINVILNSIRSKKNELINKIASFKDIDEKLVLKEFNEDELKANEIYNKYYEEYTRLKANEINLKNKLKDRCVTCDQVLTNALNEIEKAKVINELDEINRKLSENEILRVKWDLIKKEFEKKQIYNKEIEKLLNLNQNDLITYQQEVEALTHEETKFLRYQELRVKVLKDLIKNDLPFELKLFHKNKSSAGYNEVFTLLNNGVDYKYLNNSMKKLMGIELCKFFQNKLDIHIPLLLDDMESLDFENIKKINIDFIGFGVKR